MARSVARWVGIGVICLTILLVPMWSNVTKAELPQPAFFDLGLNFGSPPATERGDKDCIGYFENQEQAQRFFLEHGPKADRHHLDHDRDGKACEQIDY